MPPFYPPQFPPYGDAPPCLDVEAVRYVCTPAGLEAELHLRDVAGIGGDSVTARSLSAGTGVSPLRQTAVPGAPFVIGLSGHLPGEVVDVGLCFYRQSDADRGGYHPCCRVVVPLRTPDLSCGP